MKNKIFAFLLIIFAVLTLNCSVFAKWLEPDAWYWVDENGVLAKEQWICVDSGGGVFRYYYIDVNGKLLLNTTTPDGYKVNERGEWVDETGAVKEQQAAFKSSSIDTTKINVSSSAEKKRELKANITNKSGVDYVDAIKINNKNCVNVIKMNYSDSYIKANSGNYNRFSFEIAIKEPSSDVSYQLSIFGNGQEIDTIDSISNDFETIEYEIDPNTEIMLVYSATSESYASADAKNLYIRNATFSTERED